MNPPLIVGALPPQGPPDQNYRLVAPKPGQPLNVTILGEQWTGLIVHWITPKDSPPAGRTALCHRDTCPHCVARREKRWKGYLAAWCHDARKVRVLVGTPEAVANLARTLGYGRPIRGRRVQYIRAGKDVNGSLFWACNGDTPLAPLPPPPDIVPSMAYVLGQELPAVLARWAAEQEGLS